MPTQILYRDGLAILAGCFISLTCCSTLLASSDVAVNTAKGGIEVEVFKEVSDGAVIHDGQLLQGHIEFGVLDGRGMINGRHIGAPRAEIDVKVTPRDIELHALHNDMFQVHRQVRVRAGKAAAISAAATKAIEHRLVKEIEVFEDDSIRMTYHGEEFPEYISFRHSEESEPVDPFAAWREEVSILASTLEQDCLVVLDGDWFFATPPGMRQQAIIAWQSASADGLAVEDRHRILRSVIHVEPMASDLARRLHGLEPQGIILPMGASGDAASSREEEDGVNQVPGNDDGDDHTGFFFAAYKWCKDNGEAVYRIRVSSVEKGKGQKYASAGVAQVNFNNGNGYYPPACNLVAFHQLISSNEKKYGTLLITTHGQINKLSVEPYPRSPFGLAGRNSRYTNYLENQVQGQPEVDGTMITQEINEDAYGISVTDKFIKTYGKMPGALVYVGSCHGATLNDDFLEAGARVSAGNKEFVLVRVQKNKVSKTFTRMDGVYGIEKRPYAKAIEGLDLPLQGKGNTTLAPAVKHFDPPCPIEVDAEVIYTFDTACDTDLIPEVIGDGVDFGEPEWNSPTELKLVCTEVSEPTHYSITLKWNDLKGALNASHLDGNTKPRKKNARGVAHDDHLTHIKCEDPCPTDVNDDLSTDVVDLLLVISSWGDAGSGSPADGNQDGMVDIFDLLAVIGGWDDPCVYGSCCYDGECFPDTTVEQCDEMEGLYLGDWETCDSGLCQRGGCCIEGVECLDAFSPTDCTDMDGTYAGDGMPCDVMTCEMPVSACCFQDGSCIDSMTEYDCYDADGEFAGSGITCSEWFCPPWDSYGACCFNDPYTDETMCIESVLESDCEAFGQGEFYQGLSCYEIQCNVVGACCIDEGGSPVCTVDITQDECHAFVGTFYPLVSCDYLYEISACGDFPTDYGACCLPYGDCVPDTSEEWCYGFGGDFAGAGVDCIEANCLQWDDVGACCIFDPVDGTMMCIETIDGSDCTDWYGGTFHIGELCVDFVCDVTGGCCLGEVCIETDSTECFVQGGMFFPSATCVEPICVKTDPLGACCIYIPNTPSCMDYITEEECNDAGGAFYPDVSCEYLYNNGDCVEVEDLYGACCIESGGFVHCVDVADEASCQLKGGVFHLGATCDQVGCGW